MRLCEARGMSATWSTKYRPTSSDGLVGSALDMYRAFDNIQHAILHSKEAGTGKTTLAHVLANEKGWPIHVFNASSKKTRGIGFVEEELLPLTRMGMREQIILLDEGSHRELSGLFYPDLQRLEQGQSVATFPMP